METGHSIGIGTVSGVAKALKDTLKKDHAVILVDAHGDINNPETSGSGNIHGMPLTFVKSLASDKPVDIFGWLQKNYLVNPKTSSILRCGIVIIVRGNN